MTKEIKNRIEAVRRGEVPDGYVLENHQLRPRDWTYEIIGPYLAAYDEYSNDTEEYPLATSSRQGLMLQSEYYNDQRYDETEGGFHVVPVGYITYRHMSDDDIFRFNVNDMDKPVLVSPEYPVFTTTHELNQNLLVTYLNGMKEFRAYSSSQKKGSTRTRMYFSRLGEFSMPLPPLSEQQKIAEILATCDKVIERKQKLIEEKRRQKKWLMQKLLSENNKVEERTLSSLCSFICDGDWIESKDQSESGIRLIQTGNVGVGQYLYKDGRARFISEETFNRLNCTDVFAGDVLISRLPDPIGRACMVPQLPARAITAVDCTILRFKSKDIAQFFLQFATSQQYFNKVAILAGGSTRTRISRKEIENLLIPIPSDSIAMKSTTEVLSLMDKETATLDAELSEWQQKKKALMQLLLTGLVRVKV